MRQVIGLDRAKSLDHVFSQIAAAVGLHLGTKLLKLQLQSFDGYSSNAFLANLVEHAIDDSQLGTRFWQFDVSQVLPLVDCVERGQRRITVNYAQRQGRVAYQNQSTHLPLKVNMSGVIPAIFASSIVIFPSTLATWFSGSEGLGWLTDVSAALTPL